MSEHATGAHPTPKTYLIIAVILSVITYAEYECFEIVFIRESVFFAPLLTVLSIIKFVLVVMFFMHLRYDHNIYTRMIVLGIALAFAVFAGLAVLFFSAHPLMR